VVQNVRLRVNSGVHAHTHEFLATSHEDQKFGVVLDDAPALVAALVARLEDPLLAEEEGWRGRSHVETHHDVTTSARELARVYLRLVGARRGR
jgi:hypothetical protein